MSSDKIKAVEARIEELKSALDAKIKENELMLETLQTNLEATEEKLVEAELAGNEEEYHAAKEAISRIKDSIELREKVIKRIQAQMLVSETEYQETAEGLYTYMDNRLQNLKDKITIRLKEIYSMTTKEIDTLAEVDAVLRIWQADIGRKNNPGDKNLSYEDRRDILACASSITTYEAVKRFLDDPEGGSAVEGTEA